MRMLEHEGFTGDGYVDIFDGGPTMSVATDSIRTIKEAREMILSEIGEAAGGQRMMLATGELSNFAACYGRVAAPADGSATIDADSARLLGLETGDAFLAVGR